MICNLALIQRLRFSLSMTSKSHIIIKACLSKFRATVIVIIVTSNFKMLLKVSVSGNILSFPPPEVKTTLYGGGVIKDSFENDTD